MDSIYIRSLEVTPKASCSLEELHEKIDQESPCEAFELTLNLGREDKTCSSNQEAKLSSERYINSAEKKSGECEVRSSKKTTPASTQQSSYLMQNKEFEDVEDDAMDFEDNSLVDSIKKTQGKPLDFSYYLNLLRSSNQQHRIFSVVALQRHITLFFQDEKERESHPVRVFFRNRTHWAQLFLLLHRFLKDSNRTLLFETLRLLRTILSSHNEVDWYLRSEQSTDTFILPTRCVWDNPKLAYVATESLSSPISAENTEQPLELSGTRLSEFNAQLSSGLTEAMFFLQLHIILGRLLLEKGFETLTLPGVENIIFIWMAMTAARPEAAASIFEAIPSAFFAHFFGTNLVSKFLRLAYVLCKSDKSLCLQVTSMIAFKKILHCAFNRRDFDTLTTALALLCVHTSYSPLPNDRRPTYFFSEERWIQLGTESDAIYNLLCKIASTYNSKTYLEALLALRPEASFSPQLYSNTLLSLELKVKRSMCPTLREHTTLGLFRALFILENQLNKTLHSMPLGTSPSSRVDRKKLLIVAFFEKLKQPSLQLKNNRLEIIIRLLLMPENMSWWPRLSPFFWENTDRLCACLTFLQAKGADGSKKIEFFPERLYEMATLLVRTATEARRSFQLLHIFSTRQLYVLRFLMRFEIQLMLHGMHYLTKKSFGVRPRFNSSRTMLTIPYPLAITFVVTLSYFLQPHCTELWGKILDLLLPVPEDYTKLYAFF